jgi:hypothetical protein
MADAAAAEFREALRINPEDAVARNDLARTELLAGRYAAAVAGFGEAAALDPMVVPSGNVAVAVRAAVAGGAYAVFVVGYIGVRLLAAAGSTGFPGNGRGVAMRLAALLFAVGVVLLLGWRLIGPWRRLDAGLRPAVLRRLRQDGWLGASVLLLGLCPLLLLAAAGTPAGAQIPLLSSAVVAALVARVAVWVSAHRARRLAGTSG